MRNITPKQPPTKTHKPNNSQHPTAKQFSNNVAINDVFLRRSNQSHSLQTQKKPKNDGNKLINSV